MIQYFTLTKYHGIINNYLQGTPVGRALRGGECSMGKKKKQEKKLLKPEKEKKKDKEKLQKSEKQEKAKKAAKRKEAEAAAGPEKIKKAAKDQVQAAGQPAGRRRAVDEKAAQDAPNERMAELLRALGDENRLRILTLLEQGEVYAGDLLKSLSIVQSTLSHHMKILVEAGIVRCERRGKRSWYSIDRETLAAVSAFIGKWS